MNYIENKNAIQNECNILKHCNIASSDSKLSDLQEKYNREVEERKRLEAEIKVMHVKVSKIHTFLVKRAL